MSHMQVRRSWFLVLVLFAAASVSAQTKPRARDLGVPFDGAPGPNNAITDVEGVEVGHTTLISGEGKLEIGKGPIRTGVTAIHPRGKTSNDAVFAAWFTLNGNGEMTGHHVGRRFRIFEWPSHDHQYAQRWRRPRRRDCVEGQTRFTRHGRLLVVIASRR